MSDVERYRSAEQALFDWAGVVPKEHRLGLGSAATEVRAFEVGAGPPIVFLHGSTNSGASWITLMAALEDGFRCIAVDRPGCGLSDPLPGPLGAEGLSRHGDVFVAEVLDALGLPSASLVSTSYGGYLALRGAAAHPARIERVVQLGWSLGAPTGRLPGIMRLAGLPGMGRLMAAMPVNERAVRSMFRQIGLAGALEAGRIDQRILDSYVALLRHTDTMRNELALAAGQSLPALVRQMELPDDLLARIEVPFHFVWGEQDPFGPPEVARSFVRRIPTATLQLLPGAGHAVWLDDVDLAADAVRRSLSL